MIKLNDEVIVKVNGKYNTRGYVIQLKEDKALVQVPVFYGETQFIEVEALVNELLIPIKDYEDWKNRVKRN